MAFFRILQRLFRSSRPIHIADRDACPIDHDPVPFRDIAFVGIVRIGMRLKGVDDLIEQDVIEHLEIPVRDDK